MIALSCVRPQSRVRVAGNPPRFRAWHAVCLPRIDYVSDAEIDALAREALAIQLARYRYKNEPPEAQGMLARSGRAATPGDWRNHRGSRRTEPTGERLCRRVRRFIR